MKIATTKYRAAFANVSTAEEHVDITILQANVPYMTQNLCKI